MITQASECADARAVAVYCAASPHIDESYFEMARTVGAELARHGAAVVNGGGAMGLGISYVLSFLINTLIAANGAGDSFRSVIPPYLALGGIAFSVLVGVLAGLYPSQRAMRLSALAAIRNE